jgi:hypothetical protein
MAFGGGRHGSPNICCACILSNCVNSDSCQRGHVCKDFNFFRLNLPLHLISSSVIGMILGSLVFGLLLIGCVFKYESFAYCYSTFELCIASKCNGSNMIVYIAIQICGQHYNCIQSEQYNCMCSNRNKSLSRIVVYLHTIWVG